MALSDTDNSGAEGMDKRGEHRLSCTRCGMSVTLVMRPDDPRPSHRCAKTHTVRPFNHIEAIPRTRK